MARHNEVRLLGYLISDPSIRTDKDSTMVRVTIRLRTIRGLRDFGKQDGRKSYDEHLVVSMNPDLMKFMSHLKQYDIIDVKGNLVTMNAMLPLTCPKCGGTVLKKEMITMVNPIFMNPISTKEEYERMDPKNEMSMVEKTEKFLRKRSEISNNIAVIGDCVREPDAFSERNIVNYGLDVVRKYHIREDEPENRHDFPNVKCYGKIAQNDYKYIRKGSRVFIDGFVMSRNYSDKIVCEKCGYSWEYQRSKSEIVPYSVEYLSNCNEGFEKINNEINEGGK